MNWTLVKEIGIDAACCPPVDPAQKVVYPTFAGRARDGSYLIGDELGTEKLVPFRFESRTFRVDADGQIRFDTHALGISDGIGCLPDDGSITILCRTRWELLRVSSGGRVFGRISLATMSKRMPRIVSATPHGTWLVVFCNRGGEVDLVELDEAGRLRWFLPSEADPIGIAGSVQWTPADTILIADPLRHVAVEIDRAGKVIWQFGDAGQPAASMNHLSSPNSARMLPDGRRLIADTRNHRVLVVAHDGTAQPLPIAEGGLCDPMFADWAGNGHFLICDTGNGRIIEVDGQGQVTWQFGNRSGAERMLSYPRSVDVTGSGHYVVADTAHNRIVEFDDGGVNERPFHGDRPLFWPRCARQTDSGGLIIADGRNGRILEVSSDGRLLRELFEIELDHNSALGDPHDVHLLPDGHLLIIDSMRDLVVETDWSGRIYRAVGVPGTPELKDPHSAQRLDDGCLLIADTGHHRILLVAPDGSCRSELPAIRSDASWYRLNFPRYVEAIGDGTLVIADTGQNRVLAATPEGQLVWEFSQVPGTHIGRLNQPRWATLINRNEVVICDHFHHRILHVQYRDSCALPASPLAD